MTWVMVLLAFALGVWLGAALAWFDVERAGAPGMAIDVRLRRAAAWLPHWLQPRLGGIASGAAALGVLAVLLALALASCGAPLATTPVGKPAPIVDVPGEAVAVGSSVVLTGARAFAAAELGYITAADGLGRLARAGVIRGSRATQLRALNAEARSALVAGKGAADAAAKAGAATRLFGLTDRLNALIGSK